MSTKEEAVQRLADFHFFLEHGMKEIYRIRRLQPEGESSPDEPIKLLEVNEFTVPTGVMPLGFRSRPDRGIDYPFIIVDVTPAEFEKIRSRELKLPDGWVVGEEIPRSPQANGDE